MATGPTPKGLLLETQALILLAFVTSLSILLLTFSIYPHLSGYKEQTEWLQKNVPNMAIQAGSTEPSEGFGCLGCGTIFILLPLLLSAGLMWFAAARQRASELADLRRLVDWSSTTILAWLEHLLVSASREPSLQATHMEIATGQIRPYLPPPYVHFLDGLINRLHRSPSQTAPPVERHRDTTLRLRALSNILTVFAISTAGLGITFIFTLLSLDELPPFGFPVRPVLAFLLGGTAAAFVVPLSLLAFGLRRLEHRVLGFAQARQRLKEESTKRFCSGLSLLLGGALLSSDNTVSEPNRHVVNAAREAFLESASEDDRRAFLGGLAQKDGPGGRTSLALRTNTPQVSSSNSLAASGKGTKIDFQRSRKLELRALLAIQVAVFFTARVAFTAATAFAVQAYWIFEPELDPEKQSLQLVSFLLRGSIFALLFIFVAGFGWVCWRQSSRQEPA